MLRRALLLIVVGFALTACAEQASEEPLEPEHESEAPGVDEEPLVEQEVPEPHSYEVQSVTEDVGTDMTDLSTATISAYIWGQVGTDVAAEEIQDDHPEYDVITVQLYAGHLVEEHGEGMDSLIDSYILFASDAAEARYLADLDTYLDERAEELEREVEESIEETDRATCEDLDPDGALYEQNMYEDHDCQRFE